MELTKSEKQKLSNKKYYDKNKDVIKSKLFCKVECDVCHRIVSHQNIKKT